MLRKNLSTLFILVAGCAAVVLAVPQQPPAQNPVPPQQGQIAVQITGEPGAPPRFAVPDFVALTTDAETVEAAKTMGQVLWDDLSFEREFDMIPRDTYGTIPAARSLTDVPFDRWRELGADGLIIGTVQKVGDAIRVEAKMYKVRERQSVFGREYTGSAANPRLYAHTIADEVFQEQLGLRGVARTKLAFVSDRDGERVGGTVEPRSVKEIYIADYDGANQRRVTVNRSLNINPAWSPDSRALAYTSYRRGSPDIFVSSIYQGTIENPTKGQGENFLPVWSPDGTRIAFMSTRDGNPEIYVMNRDGSGVRRLTNHPSSDVTPTWSPTGTQIAFTSDRSGSPQIYVVGVDGLNLVRKTSESYCDRPTWSPAPYNEIAYSSRTGPGYDIKVLDLASGERRQLTFGEGSNESPAYAPNGRHLAFSSTRAGKRQIYTIERTGKDLRQVTKVGNNQTPDWSKQ
ncbi:MAG TPA: Tol-Pal system beta propeller repeat protein TolB [Vicinamibacterales bacterium]|jgi:TolB protein